MIKIDLLASSLIILLMATPTPTGTPSEWDRDPTGWTDLFADAGPDLKGWTRLPVDPAGKLNPKSQWSLDETSRVLTCQGDGGHDWLRWDKPMADFTLHVEWKFTPVTSGKTAYNSGVYVRNSADAKLWHQAQVGGKVDAFLFGQTFEDGKPKRVDLSKQQLDKRVRPAGEWNIYEVTCKGKNISLWVNGQVVNEWTGCEVPSGFLGLEAEGYRIEFREVKVKPL